MHQSTLRTVIYTNFVPVTSTAKQKRDETHITEQPIDDRFTPTQLWMIRFDSYYRTKTMVWFKLTSERRTIVNFDEMLGERRLLWERPFCRNFDLWVQGRSSISWYAFIGWEDDGSFLIRYQDILQVCLSLEQDVVVTNRLQILVSGRVRCG